MLTNRRPGPGRPGLVLAVTTLALLAGACSDSPEKRAEVVTGITTTLPVTDTAQPAAPATTATTAPATPTTPTAAKAPTTTRPPAASGSIVLLPEGLGLVSFREPADAVVARLTAKLGAPRYDGPLPNACDPSVQRNVQWDGLAVNFGPTFFGYHTGGRGEIPRYRTAEGIGLDSTVAQLKAAYASKVKVDTVGDETQYTINLPQGIIRGTTTGPDASDVVFTIFAGIWCD